VAAVVDVVCLFAHTCGCLRVFLLCMGLFSFWGLGFRVMDCCDDGKFVGVLVWDLCTRWERDWSIDRASEQWYCWLKSS